MFDRDVAIQGRHAKFVKDLAADGTVFRRYIDVYMTGAVMGLKYRRQADIDRGGDTAQILAGVFATERAKCEFLYHLVLIVDGMEVLPSQEMLDRVFRVDDSTPEKLQENMDVFHSYVRGGIDVLHELFADCVTEDDYIDKMKTISEEFELDGKSGERYENVIRQFLE